MTQAISDLFIKIVEQPPIRTIKKHEETVEVIPQDMVKTVDGNYIHESEAVFVIKRGKVVGYTKF